MKKIAAMLILITHSAHPMPESASGKNKQGQAGFLSNALGMVAGPVASTAASALENQIAKPLKEYEQAIISQITAATIKCHQEQQAQIKTLQEQVAKLQATVDKQNKCCTIQ